MIWWSKPQVWGPGLAVLGFNPELKEMVFSIPAHTEQEGTPAMSAIA